MLLPKEFIEYTHEIMGEERFGRYLKSFDELPPVSIRLNPRKTADMTVVKGQEVPWCRHGYYLEKRPNFTFDPLFHAGCYYVQEAASMFLDEVLQQHLPTDGRPVAALDLCAAPGGKSTLMLSALPEGSTLCSNEPVRQRASVLRENIAKWGYAGCTVANSYPKDIRKTGQRFDVILCDVPCSGEGMFRKDEATVREWSPQNVERCWRLQRDIVADAWACLNDGGLLVYSTCTFNTKENEENIRWIQEEFDAEVLPVDTRPEWNVTGSLLDGFTAPVYRFIPGISRGEGLFMCARRKRGHLRATAPSYPPTSAPSYPRTPLDYPQAMAYLRGEAIVLPANTPRGIVEVTFEGFTLGQVKNIGTRANNLYPKEWRIKTTHIPTEYEAILRHT